MHCNNRNRTAARGLAAALAIISLTGCAPHIERAIDCYKSAACGVRLGMTEETFAELMDSDSDELRQGREAARFIGADGEYVVHYLPAASAAHTAVSDAEYTPYTFRDGYLVAVGWEYQPERIDAAECVNPEEVLTAEESASDAGQGPTDIYRVNRPYKWCVPDVLGNGRCIGGPCC